MALSSGTRLGGYEILAALGAGGMGEVYRARDARLARDVAIKIIPRLFADSPERIARFEREAQLLAALNHPHIAAIYGIEDSPAGRFLVLEYVEGLSLAQHLEAAPQGIPVDEALPIARQIVDALEAAHDKGIIHRDLKPANIMLTPDGQVKVLDFGLARAADPEPSASIANSPTLTFAATQAGIILGTAAYMSPEQAKGRVADRRTDVWAFGCVLYEMLTGRRAFDGEDVSDTLAAILRGEPDWSALPPEVPEHVRTILRRCLERDRKARIPDISVVRYLLAEPGRADARAGNASGPVRLSRARFLAAAGFGVLGGVMLTAAAWFAATLWTPATPPQQVRFTITPPPERPLYLSQTDRTAAVSPDGTYLAYIARLPSAEWQLMLRRIDQLDAVALAGTISARTPFFSHDGRWIGFWAQGELRKVSVTGGPAMLICRTAGGPRGATWMANDTIVFATAEAATGLFAVPAGGGEPVKLTTPAPGADHIFPHAVADANEVLFTNHPFDANSGPQIALLDVATKQHVVLLAGGGDAEYVETGHIVYGASGALRSVRYDAAARKVLGDPVPVQDGVTTLANGAAAFALSRNGHLLFVPGAATDSAARRTLVWVDRQGRETPIPSEPAAYSAPRLSPDGSRLAYEIREPEQDIWTLDISRHTPARFTFDVASDVAPLWTRDGKRILFQSSRSGSPNIYWQASDGTGAVERVADGPNLKVPHAITRDGKLLVLMEFVTGPDLKVLRLDGRSKPEPLIVTQFVEANPHLSPDDRWLAYQTNESGRNQIWVRPFPDVDSGRWQVSPSGVTPVWSASGDEIFYRDGTALMSVAVETTPVFRSGKPVKLFEHPYFASAPGRLFDVSSDGKRFVFVKEAATSQPSASAALVVVLNWIEDLKVKLPSPR